MASHLRKKSRIGGFTFVELIVVVSVIATISVIGMVYGSGYKTSSNNAERLSDVDTLKLAAESYFRAKGDYPEPTGNRVYFDSNGSYEHSATGAYGVSSLVTGDLFWSEFLAEVPKDPETGNHYWYGKRKDGVAAYDFAAVDRRSDGYFAYVRGTYDGSSLPSLIREYNGPNFVEDGKVEHLPYNPFENKITAKIAAYSGSVTVTPAKSLTGELAEGDVINVPSGWFAVFHVSDGTEARMGSASSPTELKLENLVAKDSKGFLTKVRFALNSGEIWTKAPKLREDRGERSELEITTGTAVASVRGTVFGVTKSPAGTDVTLVVGKLEITTLSAPVEAAWMTWWTVSVEEGGIPKKVSMPNSESGGAVVTPAPEASSENLPWNGGKNVNKAKLKKVKRTSGTYQIVFNNERGFKKVTVPVSATVAGAADVKRNVSGTGIASVTFTTSELAYLPNYVSGPTTVSANSEFVRLPLRFEGDGELLAETEIVIPRWNADFEYDEESIPSWTGMECAAGYAWFESEGCQPKSLRAVAKFDSFTWQGNEFWDLYLYDRLGNRLPTIQNFLSAKDMSGKNYVRAFWRSASPSYADTWAFRTAANGSKGIVMETSNRDDYLAYDVSRLDVNHQDFAITVWVLSSGLSRTYSAIEKESNSPSLSDERRAYLWSLPDGTSLYYRVRENDGDDDSRHGARPSLVLVDSTGNVRATAEVPASVASLPLQNASVETRFTTKNGVQNAKISVFFEKSSSFPSPDFVSATSEVIVGKPLTAYLGSTKPKIENGSEKFDFNWGGKKDCWNSSIEIVDSFKIFSFD